MEQWETLKEFNAGKRSREKWFLEKDFDWIDRVLLFWNAPKWSLKTVFYSSIQFDFNKLPKQGALCVGSCLSAIYWLMERHTFEPLEGRNIIWHIVAPPPPPSPSFSLSFVIFCTLFGLACLFGWKFDCTRCSRGQAIQPISCELFLLISLKDGVEIHLP